MWQRASEIPGPQLPLLEFHQGSAFDTSGRIRIGEFRIRPRRFASFRVAFRAPSGTLCLVRAYSDDSVGAFSPHPEKGLIGVLAIAGVPFLCAKLSRQKNLEAGCALRLPCFCSLMARRGSLLFPVHAMWPAIRRRVVPGTHLLKDVNRRSSTRISKTVLWKMHIPEAGL